MRNADLYKGISPDKQAEYEAWLVEQYGGDMPAPHPAQPAQVGEVRNRNTPQSELTIWTRD